MNSEQLEQQEMKKLAGAASLVKELAEGHGIDIDNLTEEEAQDLLGQAYVALHGSVDEHEEKTASVYVKELSQTEEGMQKLAAASEVGEGLLQEEGISPDDLTEEQAAEVILHVLNNYEFASDEEEEKTASVIIDEISQTDEGLQKLAAAGEVAHEALQGEGISPDDLTEDQAAELLLEILIGGEEQEEKTAAVIIEELGQTEEGMQKLSAAGEVANEVLQGEGISPDDLTEDQAAELLLEILIGGEEQEEKTAAVQDDLEKIAALRQAGAIMYSGFADAAQQDMEKEAGAGEAIMKALRAAASKTKGAGKWMVSPKVKGMATAKESYRSGLSPRGRSGALAGSTKMEKVRALLRGYGGELTRPVIPAAALAVGGTGAAMYSRKKKK